MSHLDAAANTAVASSVQDQSRGRRILNRDSDGLVQGQLGVVGPATAIASDEFSDLGMNVIRIDRPRLKGAA